MKNVYILTEFLCWLENQNYDYKTLQTYERYLVRYNDFLISHYQITLNDPEQFQIIMLDQYVSLLQTRYAPKTVNLVIASIRSYMKYCDRMDYCQYDYRRLAMVKEDDTEAIFVNKEDFETIIARIALQEKDRLTRIRNILICKFLFESMLRVSEVCNIQLGDFNTIGKTVFLQVVGKGKKLRTVAVSPKVYAQLLDYVRTRSFGGDYVFVSHAHNSLGQTISRNSIAHIIAKYRELCHIEKKITPHSFRHGGATNLISYNPPLPVVQKALGHKHITTTQRYLHIVNDDIAKYQSLVFSD